MGTIFATPEGESLIIIIIIIFLSSTSSVYYFLFLCFMQCLDGWLLHNTGVLCLVWI